MRKRIVLTACATLLATGASLRERAPQTRRLVADRRPYLCQRQRCRRQHHRGVRPPCDGSLTPTPGSPYAIGGRVWAPGSARRASSKRAQIDDSCSQSMRAAPTSQSSVSVATAFRTRSAHRCGQAACVRSASLSSPRPCVCRQRRRRRKQLHRFPAHRLRRPHTTARHDRPGTGRFRRGRRAVQLHRRSTRRHPRQPVTDRQLHPPPRRTPHRSAWITVPSTGPRPDRCRVPTHQPLAATCNQRARRSEQRPPGSAPIPSAPSWSSIPS